MSDKPPLTDEAEIHEMLHNMWLQCQGRVCDTEEGRQVVATMIRQIEQMQRAWIILNEGDGVNPPETE
ncbi:hypothetical protein [Pelagibacterium lentulum]|uniref:Uncharacterized protein n=1 Tax=Pelagibacterium lentulum TaxID=2029865 RepID=A0A916RS22_9HYPH|nr:hypothetical protein [Pelagibacterium lentulum]GGA64947.1 hypothetical protein GCM10011499_39250 [Pelagibacterium lentulum]